MRDLDAKLWRDIGTNHDLYSIAAWQHFLKPPRADGPRVIGHVA